MQKHNIIKNFLLFISLLFSEASIAQTVIEDTLQRKKQLTYFKNWKDTYLNRFSFQSTPLFNFFPDSLKTKVTYNSSKGNISIDEKISNKIDLKIPQSMSFNEYSSIQNAMIRKSILRDLEKAQDGNTSSSGKRLNP